MTPMLPNALTVARIVVAPVICVLIAVDQRYAAWTALALWIGACLTDFLDGWLARRHGIVSNVGRFLDPIADKILVALVLLVLVGVDRLPGLHMIPAAVILAREIVVSGLREHLAEFAVTVPVSRLAKWKTATQMVAMAFLVIGPFAPALGPLEAMQVGIWGVWLAAALTAITGWGYLRAGIAHMTGPQRHAESESERSDPARGGG